ncbi:unnamed protein product [Scytosiphon promiscuus]
MGLVGTVLRAVVLWVCLCAGRAFFVRPTTTHGVARRAASTSAATSAARSRPLVASELTQQRVSRSSRWVRMSSADQDVSTGGGTGTGVQTIVKDEVKQMEEVENKEDLDKEQWWRVILHNDEIHTFDYVTQSITKVVKKLTMKKAYEVTMETHKAGKATVTQAWKSKSESYCLQLQQCGLTASIAPDNKFEGDGDGEGGGDGSE